MKTENAIANQLTQKLSGKALTILHRAWNILTRYIHASRELQIYTLATTTL